ncbi:MAG: hypothetical protein FJX59_03925 [Alphaproteobacteria bacterium]|nr:hypothetical protein [Alphaproteobacteria bacterium]
MGFLLKVLMIGGALLVLWFIIKARFRVKVSEPIIAFLGKAKAELPPRQIETLVKCPACGAHHPAGKPCICGKA